MAHCAQGQNLNKLSEGIEDLNALPAVSALARVLSNVSNARQLRGSMFASARGLEFKEDESGNAFCSTRKEDCR
jgi:hypothetical protein